MGNPHNSRGKVSLPGSTGGGLFILPPKVVYSPHNTINFFDFTRDLKVNEYDQLKPFFVCGKFYKKLVMRPNFGNVYQKLVT